MELKEYLNIIKKHRNLFFGIIIAIVAIVLCYFYFLPERYDASLMLSITRSGSQETADYKYDDFYRLQADEKFAETLVEWIKNPRIQSDIYAEAGIGRDSFDLGGLAKKLSAEKRSSQVVAVSFSANTSNAAQKISAAAARVIENNTQKLNEDQKEKTWFKIVSAQPVIEKYQPDYKIIFLASLLLGIFLGFWGVMVKHYIE